MHSFRIIAAASFAAFLSLAACNSEPETIKSGPADAQADDLAKAAPVEAPPMIQASRTYRCKDNSLVYIDFYTNNTAQVRTEKGGAPTILTAGQPAAEGAEPSSAYTAEGYSLSGNTPQVTLSMPGKGSQSCKA
ncbi:MAG TPA: hypothetical protein VGW34_02875 [Allosphingosinicella sp.]|nr:hypothetical protein [Allosphingosinicella sp.]